MLQKDRVALRFSVVTIKYLAEEQSVLECWQWDHVAVQLLCWEPVQVSLCTCPCPASSTHELPFWLLASCLMGTFPYEIAEYHSRVSFFTVWGRIWDRWQVL